MKVLATDRPVEQTPVKKTGISSTNIILIITIVVVVIIACIVIINQRKKIKALKTLPL